MCCAIQSHIRTCVLHGMFDSFTYIDMFMCQHPQDLSILTDPQDKHSSKTSGQNTNAGWFNRYIQTGKSDHETKSNGCIGGMMCTYMHNLCLSFIRLAILVWYTVQQSQITPNREATVSAWSAARGRETCTRPRRSSCYKESGAITAAWRRP